MKIAQSDRRSAEEAEVIYARAVAHSERGECEEALTLVDRAIQLEPQRRFVDRRAVILEQLGRHAEAVAARREAVSIADQVMLSHLEEVLELRSDGDRALTQLREGSFAASEIDGREQRADTVLWADDQAMMSSLHPLDRVVLKNILKDYQPRPIDLSAILSESPYSASSPPRPAVHAKGPAPKPAKTGWNVKRAALALLRRLTWWRR